MSQPNQVEQMYHPNMKVPGVGLYCFMSQERPCGPDCMAYLSEVPNQPDYVGQQWAHCHLLVNAHRGGKHLVVLAQASGELVKKAKTEFADRVRSSQSMPPEPR